MPTIRRNPKAVSSIMRWAPSRSGAALSPFRCLAQRMYRLRAPPQGALRCIDGEPARYLMHDRGRVSTRQTERISADQN